MLKTWRTARGKSQGECAAALGMRGGARSFQRIETGENAADADMVERIERFTGGAVTAADMHAVRLAWLKANRPEKFEVPPSVASGDASRVPAASGSGPAVSPDDRTTGSIDGSGSKPPEGVSDRCHDRRPAADGRLPAGAEALT